ncbi:3-oxoacyl-ACP reductase FabG [Candidatus Protochlamydia phocaeensis]|uniref:3-oxoacyl-ACP reductase FabG n=1 Tax=Candidatus Protochlamydia phocaeensis TaxID=1414722 RepID=UPI000837BAED|nr:3-oxoacyl-ACP reductase FabG [Candidatus Protochlamydia phocaeensis]
MKQLTDQIAVVTGGNAGIGKAIALKLAELGAKVAIFGTNAETGAAVLAEIQALSTGKEARFYQVDVAKTSAVEEAIKRVTEEMGAIDILVNNAGITADQLLMKMSEEEWDRVLNINLKSCYNTCHAVIRAMMKAKKGRIINISSVVGLMGNAGQVNYAASKAGMIGFTKALAKEVASRGILVNCIAPGFICTKMTESLSDSQKEAILKDIPLGYMGEPTDIANLVCFLASPLANYITGQVIAVDGGMTM